MCAAKRYDTTDALQADDKSVRVQPFQFAGLRAVADPAARVLGGGSARRGPDRFAA
ncbi:hypothetical protein [Streptomyces sp. NPDC101234]|uniref:hypothetical protein n=1 Tax=Streptomyces sp. NPDC101234 TaxID=3366138 RepID=UPI0038291343